jgi:2,5-furandicarboxylate decarboxylase 1
MSVRSFLEKLSGSDALVTIEKAVDVQYELANVAHALPGKTVLFNKIESFPGWRVVSGMCGDRKFFSLDLDVPVNELTHHLANALANPMLPPVVEKAPCQEVVLKQFDLNNLPVLLHLPEDAGHYIASNVVITGCCG